MKTTFFIILICLFTLDLAPSVRSQSTPQSITDLPDTTCSHLFGLGYELSSSRSTAAAAYDTLRLFLEQCPLWRDGGNGSVAAFSFILGDVPGGGPDGPAQWQDFLQFLKKVLYLNPDTAWYCADVSDMLTAEQTDHAMQLAEIKYILDNHRCPVLSYDWVTAYNSASKGRHKQWLDSLRYIFDTTYKNDYYWPDSIGADTMEHPYDSTIPSLQQVGLEILMGPQYAVTQPNTPITSQALLNASILDNPMKDEIAVGFEMGRTALVTMELRDILGRSIPLTFARYQLMQQGMHKAYIPAPNLPPGTYYLRISTDVGDVITLKVVKE